MHERSSAWPSERPRSQQGALPPLLVHSTSWRQEDGRLVLTYLAVLAEPASAYARTMTRAERYRRPPAA